MKQIELTSKLVLALIAIVVASAMISAPVIAQSAPPIRDNSVTSASIKNGEVKTEDLANNAVISTKIADGTIQSQDLASGATPPDTIGSLQTTIKRVSGDVTSGSTSTFRVNCDAGQVVTGGGYVALSGDGSTLIAITNFPEDSNTWHVTIEFQGDFDEDNTRTVSAYAVCAQIVQQ